MLDASSGARVEDVAVDALALREVVTVAAARDDGGEPISGRLSALIGASTLSGFSIPTRQLLPSGRVPRPASSPPISNK